MTSCVQQAKVETHFDEAIVRSDFNAMKRLVLSGININERYKGGKTPLHLAIIGCEKEMVKLLLAQPGIAINQQDDMGWTPLHDAVAEPHRKQIPLVMDMIACLLNHPGIAVNTTNKAGWAPLHYAVRDGNTQIVKLLLKHRDINVSLATPEGLTPLKLATRKKGYEKTAKIVQKHLKKFQSVD
eukprot:gene281-366_t